MGRPNHTTFHRSTLSKPLRTTGLSWLLGTARSVSGMRVQWRFALVAIVGVAVLGGLMPHGIATTAASVTRPVVQFVEEPLAVPVTCADAMCGKGSPAPTAPSPVVALAGMLGIAVITAAAVATVKHRRAQAGALPTGASVSLFHPPQFS